jgi:hypothetical protein
MKNIKQFTAFVLALVVFGIGFTANAQMRMNDKNAMYIIKRLETNTDQFRDHLDVEKVFTAKDEDIAKISIEASVASFEFMTDRLQDRAEDNEVISSDVEGILSRAFAIERSIQKAKISNEARADWMRVKSNLDDLAKAYNVTWVWTLNANPYWKNPRAAEEIIDRLENQSDEFRRSFNFALDASRLDGTKIEDRASKLVDDFEDQVDRWEDLSDNERRSASNIKNLMQKAMVLDDFIRTSNLSTRTKRDWTQVRLTLDELAMMTNIEWKWNATPVAVK